MDTTEARRRIEKLRKEVAHHDELYYRSAKPEVTDFEYDVLKRELADLEAKFPELASADSPTARVGDDRVQGFREVAHRQRMLSLDNTYSEQELRAFHARLTRLLGEETLHYTVEPKIDGVAVSLTYESGKFVRAVTRGKGDKGDDITANALTIESIPRELKRSTKHPVPDIVEIRGEIYLTAAEFERLNAERAAAGEDLYMNPRNTAAGTIKQLDSAEVAKRKLSIVLYGMGWCEPQVVKSQVEWHASLKAWGLPTVERIWTATGIDEAWTAIGELDNIRRKFAYGTDGAVVKLDLLEQQRDAGATDKAPRWAIAYKYKPDTARTRLRAITIQVGKTGVLSPVAELEPVLLAGSTISRATLHNEDEIRRKDIRIGDLVEIEKAGEVIPAVLRSFPEERPAGAAEFSIHEAVGGKCPVCGGGIAKVEVAGEEAEGVAWRCTNYDCKAQRAGRLGFFCARGVLAIDGVGGVVASKLVELDLVRDPPDLYEIPLETLWGRCSSSGTRPGRCG
jgi:DNA ligase (NAD+)